MARQAAAILATIGLVTTAVAQQDEQALSLPDEFTVHAVGTYRGGATVEAQLDNSGHSVTQAEVVVNQTDKPIVLVLTAYDPVVWRVGRTETTSLAAVVVSGYHGQALIGIEEGTPVVISTYENKGPFPYFYACKASPKLLEMNESVERLVGREIDRFDNEPIGGVFYVGEQPAPGEAVRYSDDLKLEHYLAPDRPLAGQPAMDALVRQGKLRPADQADIDAWEAKASKPYQRMNPRLSFDSPLRPENTYVVLDELTLPEGLRGSHSRSFLLDAEAPFPKGPRGHNSFYLSDGTAIGPFTNR